MYVPIAKGLLSLQDCLIDKIIQGPAPKFDCPVSVLYLNALLFFSFPHPQHQLLKLPNSMESEQACTLSTENLQNHLGYGTYQSRGWTGTVSLRQK
jgi:hypothetical protein